MNLMGSATARERIRKRLAQLIREQNKSRADIERKTGVSQSQLSNFIKHGKPWVAIEKLETVTTYLKADISYLLVDPGAESVSLAVPEDGTDVPTSRHAQTVVDPFAELRDITVRLHMAIDALRRAAVDRQQSNARKTSARVKKAAGKRRTHQRGA